MACNFFTRYSFTFSNAREFRVMDIFNTILAIGLTIGAALFAYVGLVMNQEMRTGKPHRMFWERKEKRKIFDKSDLEYKDGDNT